MKGSAEMWKDSSLGREKDTFLTRFVGGGDFGERLSKEQTESVGDDRLRSGVHARELTDPDGEWQLEARDELTEPGRIFLRTDSSAELMSEAAWSKWVRACCSRLVRNAEVEGRGRAQISIEVAA